MLRESGLIQPISQDLPESFRVCVLVILSVLCDCKSTSGPHLCRRTRTIIVAPIILRDGIAGRSVCNRPEYFTQTRCAPYDGIFGAIFGN